LDEVGSCHDQVAGFCNGIDELSNSETTEIATWPVSYFQYIYRHNGSVGIATVHRLEGLSWIPGKGKLLFILCSVQIVSGFRPAS
jgi:hypothetical protein